MLDRAPIKINEEFHDILNQITEGDNLFITGRAGTGKSTLLRMLKQTTKKNAVVVAPTGLAALNIGGQTIHSFFKFPPKMIDPKHLSKRRNHKFYKKLQLLIIDEISMVRADLIDAIDVFLRNNLERHEPFGGVQLVVFGDLFQLPPVVASAFEKKFLNDKYGSPYFFAARVLTEDLELQMIELQTVYRQEDRHFVNLLDNIRTRQFDYDDLETLNQRHGAAQQEDQLQITLCATNAKVNAINTAKLKEIESPTFEFEAKVTGAVSPTAFPADQFLWLKAGAQVMFVKNDPEGRYVNGTLGKIIDLNNENIVVSIHTQEEAKFINVDLEEWEVLKYELDDKNENQFTTKTIGTYKQYPLKLAWAITIHKSQGKTYDSVCIDLGTGAFDYGQTYVALSRCRTLQGIYLKKKILPKDIMVDQRVVEYYEMQKRR